MLSCYLKFKKKTESKNPGVTKTKNGKLIIFLKCVNCGSNKIGFIKEQETSGLLSSLGMNTPLSKISLVGPILI